MSVIVVGLEQKRAPLELLDRVSVTEADTAKALGRLRDQPNLSEAVLLSTCLRTEVYAVVERFHDGVDEIQEFLAELGGSSRRGAGRLLHHPLRRRRHRPPLLGGLRTRLRRPGRVRGPRPGAPGLGAVPGRARLRSRPRRPVPPRRRDRQARPIGDGHRPGHHLVVPRRRRPGRHPPTRWARRHPGGRHRGRARWARAWPRP